MIELCVDTVLWGSDIRTCRESVWRGSYFFLSSFFTFTPISSQLAAEADFSRTCYTERRKTRRVAGKVLWYGGGGLSLKGQQKKSWVSFNFFISERKRTWSWCYHRSLAVQFAWVESQCTLLAVQTKYKLFSCIDVHWFTLMSCSFPGKQTHPRNGLTPLHIFLRF